MFMILFLALIAELTVLFLLSRLLVQKIYAFFVSIFRSHSVGLSLTLVLLFPGTVIHELAHLFTAEILGVRTGKLKLTPEALEGSVVSAGSVSIAQTDPLRRNLIGLAPIFAGIIALTALSYFPDLSNLTNLSNWTNWLIFYLFFAISNSMFSSKEDLKEFLPLAITAALIIGAAYLAGLRIFLTGEALVFGEKLLETLVGSLTLVVAVNLGLLLILGILLGFRRQHLL